MSSEARIDQYLDGEMSPDQLAAFEQWLQAPANLDRFVQRARLHADLRRSLTRQDLQQRAGRQLQAASGADGPTDVLVRSRGPRFANSRTTAALLVTAGTLCLMLLLLRQVPVGAFDRSLASVESAIDAQLFRDNQRWQRSGLPAGTYELKQGLLHLRFPGGVMVYVEAPAEFSADSGQCVVLQKGRLSAHVPPAGVGFTVETPDAQVVDYGTEFSVDVAPGASEVHVFEGLVRVQPKHTDTTAAAIDVRRSEAVKVNAAAETAEDIALAPDRFIRNFDEPKMNYRRAVLRMSPLAYYPMPIRDRGLIAQPEQYSGVVLTGPGKRPPHARGVFTGGSLRVLADSSGRGGRIDAPPRLGSGKLTVTAFVYCESPTGPGTLATNFGDQGGSFSLGVDADGRLTASVQTAHGRQTLRGHARVPQQQWRHVVMTVDGDSLRLYEDGQRTAQMACEAVATASGTVLWLGTDDRGEQLWDGRIDELAIFDRPLTAEDVLKLYQTARQNQRELESR